MLHLNTNVPMPPGNTKLSYFSFFNRHLSENAQSYDVINSAFNHQSYFSSIMSVPVRERREIILNKSYSHYSRVGVLIGVFLGLAAASIVITVVATSILISNITHTGIIPSFHHITVYDPSIWMCSSVIVAIMSMAIGLTLFFHNNKTAQLSLTNKFFLRNNILNCSIKTFCLLSISLLITFIILRFTHFQVAEFVKAIGTMPYNSTTAFIGIFGGVSILSLVVSIFSAYMNEKCFHRELLIKSNNIYADNRINEIGSESDICFSKLLLLYKQLTLLNNSYKQIDSINHDIIVENHARELQHVLNDINNSGLWNYLTAFLLVHCSCNVHDCEFLEFHCICLLQSTTIHIATQGRFRSFVVPCMIDRLSSILNVGNVYYTPRVAV